ncbi:ANK_REP_REGION domain-containing protein [Trichoderma simmonsii]|uniref:ANK_REP_REGION domain-containing protein n=1 Tax=Trichoderma simmonsii TaxID=1491479 RepID=A0A8G0PM18_9HYPO|nr:ANK_REP_REGION domain-containing protein [Trichoderma simmonsii]
MLIDKEAHLNARDRNVWTPLLVAVHFGREKAVKLLLDTGKVDNDARDVNHEAVWSLAFKKRGSSIVQLLSRSLAPIVEKSRTDL